MEYFESEVALSINQFIDFIWVPSTGLLATFAGLAQDDRSYYPHTVSRNLGNDKAHCFVQLPPHNEQAKIYGIAIALYRTWINNTSGADIGLDENAAYFGFNDYHA